MYICTYISGININLDSINFFFIFFLLLRDKARRQTRQRPTFAASARCSEGFPASSRLMRRGKHRHARVKQHSYVSRRTSMHRRTAP